MTQHELIMLYVQEFGEIIPAKMNGKSYYGGFFGSETSRRCRELRKEGKLQSEGTVVLRGFIYQTNYQFRRVK